jgi:hypothetical protein
MITNDIRQYLERSLWCFSQSCIYLYRGRTAIISTGQHNSSCCFKQGHVVENHSYSLKLDYYGEPLQLTYNQISAIESCFKFLIHKIALQAAPSAVFSAGFMNYTKWSQIFHPWCIFNYVFHVKGEQQRICILREAHFYVFFVSAPLVGTSLPSPVKTADG